MTTNFCEDASNFAPYKRNPETLARNWAVPGMEGMEHRIGGLEKQDVVGTVSHDPMNHQKMTEIRQEKVDRIANEIPPVEIIGEKDGDILVIGWGSTYGAIKTAVDKLLRKGQKISYVHLKHINPLPKDLGDIIKRFDKILVPEMNLGQLRTILHAKYFKPMIGLNKVQGQPFRAAEIENKILELLQEKEVNQ
jgi:2-oxoglutarate ferredoxin oxidoreductase subunit alpha